METIDGPGALYRQSLATATDPPPSAGAAVELADAVRRLVEAVTGTNAGDELLERVTTEVDRLTAALQPHSEDSRYLQAERLGVGGGGSFITHPVIGPLNPFAPRVAMTPSGEHLVGTVIYGPPFEGPHGYVHGGQIASCFDAVLAMTAGIGGRAGVTKWLRVDFLKPTRSTPRSRTWGPSTSDATGPRPYEPSSGLTVSCAPAGRASR